MSTGDATPDKPSRRLRVTVQPEPAIEVVPSSELDTTTVRVEVARVPLTELNQAQKAEHAAKALAAAQCSATPQATPPSPAVLPDPDNLPNDTALLKQMIAQLLQMLNSKSLEADKYKHQLDQLLRKFYGVKSEKFTADQAMPLFPELNAQDNPQQSLAVTEDVPEQSQESGQKGKSKRRGHGRNRLPENLRREKHLHELPEEQRQCPHCQATCEKFGEDVSEQLDYLPASLFIHEHSHCKYACPKCHDYVVVAGKPPQPIDKGLPGPGLLAHVVVSKYADHLPLHRQERILARHGVRLSRSTTCTWMRSCAQLLKPLYNLMVSEVLKSRLVHTDDTKVRMQDLTKPGKMTTARLWVYLGDWEHPYNVFDFTLDWSRDGPREFLRGFANYLQADGLTGYDSMGSGALRRAGCWAHGRRYFFDAKGSDPVRSAQALVRIGRLYKIEEEAKELIAKEKLRAEDAEALRLRLRQEKAVPELTALHSWLTKEQSKVLPKSPLGQAISYVLNQWSALELYSKYGFLDIDNNIAEQTLRLIAVGRKNWLFVGSARGGETAAVLFTMTSTCQRLKIDPYVYLQDVFKRLAGGPLPPEELAKLLPNRWRPAAAQTTS